MKVLILGSGGREHALAWAVKRSHRVTEVVCAPGNGGIAQIARCVPVDLKNLDEMVRLVEAEQPGLTIVGPEFPLSLGIVDALMDSIPLVVITGQVATHLIGTDAFQECDTIGITRPCTKHNYLVKSVDELPRVIHEAFHIATSGRPGPVVIDIPKDVQFAKGRYQGPNEVKPAHNYAPRTKGDPARIAEAAAAINPKIRLIAGGFHLVVAPDDMIAKVVTALKDRFNVENIAPGHCTGEPTFAALKKAFGDKYLYAGLGTSIPLGANAGSGVKRGEGPINDDLSTYRRLAAREDPFGVMRARTQRLGANL